MGEIPQLFVRSDLHFGSLQLSHITKIPPSFCSLATGPSTSGHQLCSSSPTGFTDITVLGYGVVAMGTKPENSSALQNSQVAGSVAALSMGLPAVSGCVPLFKVEHT